MTRGEGLRAGEKWLLRRPQPSTPFAHALFAGWLAQVRVPFVTSPEGGVTPWCYAALGSQPPPTRRRLLSLVSFYPFASPSCQSVRESPSRAKNQSMPLLPVRVSGLLSSSPVAFGPPAVR